MNFIEAFRTGLPVRRKGRMSVQVGTGFFAHRDDICKTLMEELGFDGIKDPAPT